LAGYIRLVKGDVDIHTSRIHFIHTNDLHSQFDHWPKTVAMVRRIKKECEQQNEPYVIVDIGDHMDRSHFITEASLGLANVDMMNHVGYDFTTIGNNEGITFSKQQLSQMYSNAQFRVLVNNVYENENKSRRPSWLAPYAIHQCGDVRIGLIGATINFDLFYQLLGWSIKDPIESITEQVQQLRNDVDLVVILSHLGLSRDEQMAQNIEGIDLILGGHTHHLLQDGLQVQGSWINQAGRAGKHVGHVTVEYTSKGKHAISSTCRNVEDEAPDQETVALLAKWRAHSEKKLSQSVVVLEEELNIDWYNESVFGNLLAEGVKDWCNTPISIINAGQILDRLDRGKVSKADLLRICPHPINPCSVKITGEELYLILERSLELDFQSLKIRGLGFRGKVLGMLCIDGIDVHYSQGLDGKKELSIFQGNKSIKKDQLYEVATLDMFTFGPIFPELFRATHVQYFLPEFLRDVLAFRLEQGDFERAKRKRWTKKEHRG
jgi:5'-nucleotidase